jgi:membrane protein
MQEFSDYDLEIKEKLIVRILDFLRIKNQKFRRFVAFIELLLLRLDKNHVFLVSAGISFNILLYLIPLFLVAVYVVNLIFGTNTISTTLEEMAVKFLPPNESTVQFIHSIIEEVNYIFSRSSVAGWIGIFGLFWLSSALFGSLRAALNTIFEIESPYIFLIYKLKDILITLILAVLILILSFIIPLISVVSSFFVDILPDFLRWLFNGFNLTIISLTYSFLLFYFIFRFVPNKKQSNSVIMTSTIMCIVLVEISRHLFDWYVTTVSNYGRFYGTYAIIISIAVWVYYFSLIILLTAEFSKLFFEVRNYKKQIRNKKSGQ